jgi:hypothetical protein
MSRRLPASFLTEQIGLLVLHFGADKVRAALANFSKDFVPLSSQKPPAGSVKAKEGSSTSIPQMLSVCQRQDDQKYRLLSEFYTNLKNRSVLPESQDIRQFAQVVGLKDIRGKSRKDMIPRLMRFLLGQSTDKLVVGLRAAADVSEQKRRQGYSVLTDKLLGEQ